MTDAEPFALVVLVVAAAGLLAVLSNRLTERVQVPAPAFFLVAAAVAVKAIPVLHAPSVQVVQRTVVIALVFILFNGGMDIGRTRFRSAAVAITAVGVIGTLLTAAACGAFVHFAFGLGWYVSLLVGIAVSPTDPAVVFSVLGRREVSGRSGTILEGESGANDPIGIALMTALLAAGGVSLGAFAHAGGEFALQIGVGAVVGIVGGRMLLVFMRRVPLPSEGLYPLRTIASALLVFSVATLAHGSGFLAVFAAGIVLGDERAPYKGEIERFHSAIASLAEIVAFVLLGLTVDLAELAHPDVWVPGLVLGAVLAFAVRPILVGLCLVPTSLTVNERGFVLFAGLRGAVPILLGTFLVTSHVADAKRLYGIVVIVVMFSVVVQGGLVPTVARLLHIPMRTVEPEPWALGVRLRDEPSGVHRFTIAARSPINGRTIAELTDLPGGAWISLVVRAGQTVPARGSTRLQTGDELLVLADPYESGELTRVFEEPPRSGRSDRSDD